MLGTGIAALNTSPMLYQFGSEMNNNHRACGALRGVTSRDVRLCNVWLSCTR